MLKLKRTIPQQVDLAIKRGMSLQDVLAQATRINAPRQMKDYIRTRFMVEKRSKANRLPLRNVVRNRALRKLNPTARWLYACLADQHDRVNSELEATRPTLKRLYGWEPSALTVKRALDALLKVGLIECVKSQPHSKWARYRLAIQNVY